MVRKSKLRWTAAKPVSGEGNARGACVRGTHAAERRTPEMRAMDRRVTLVRGFSRLRYWNRRRFVRTRNTELQFCQSSMSRRAVADVHDRGRHGLAAAYTCGDRTRFLMAGGHQHAGRAPSLSIGTRPVRLDG